MKKRVLSLATAALMACSLLAGCGGGETAATTTAPAAGGTEAPAAGTEAPAVEEASGEEVVLELYLQKTNVVDIFKEMIADFESKNPGIKIELTSVPDPETALVTRIASNDYPDIVTIWPAEKFYRDLMRDGALMDISDQAFLDVVAPGTREIAQYDGKDYSLSMTMSAYGIIVNNRLLKENGIEKPQTWDELIAAAETLKANGRKTQIKSRKQRWYS